MDSGIKFWFAFYKIIKHLAADFIVPLFYGAIDVSVLLYEYKFFTKLVRQTSQNVGLDAKGSNFIVIVAKSFCRFTKILRATSA